MTQSREDRSAVDSGHLAATFRAARDLQSLARRTRSEAVELRITAQDIRVESANLKADALEARIATALARAV